MSHRNLIVAAALLRSLVSCPAEEFILSYWCGPPPTENLDQRYAEVAECHFNYAMVPCSGVSAQDNQAILDACKKHKLKYIVRDSRLLGFAPSHPSFQTNLDAVISDYARHPALGGYILTDEPGPAAFPQLAAVNQYLLKHDPQHLPFINLLPNYAPEWMLGGPYEQHIETFVTTVKPRLLCFDHYALMTDGSARPIYFENLEIIRRQSLKHDVPFGFIFQVTPHAAYRNPSEEDLRWQVNTALAYGAKALLHFTYWSPTNDPLFKTSNAIIGINGKQTPHYERAKRINAAVMTWAPTLMKLESTGVYHTGQLPRATQGLPQGFIVRFEDQVELVVATFRHQDKSEWLMMVNRDLRKPVNTTLHFTKAIRRARELSTQTGKLSFGTWRNDLPISLPAGGAKLFKLSR